MLRFAALRYGGAAANTSSGVSRTSTEEIEID